jgi:hypothetical protein
MNGGEQQKEQVEFGTLISVDEILWSKNRWL